jgi:hypothetical protein
LEAFYNKELNQYIFAANRCGTSFLNSEAVKNIGWKKVNHVGPELNTATVVKVIRDPYERWICWFDNFVLHYSDIDWTVDQSNQWIKKFKKTLSNDLHTEKQSILLNSIKTGNSQIIYIHMEDLNIFLKISDQRHVINYRDRFENLPENSRKLFFFKIKKIYNEDYKWIKTLSFLKF